MASCKQQLSTKELNQRLKRISDDLQDVHSKLNNVVAQQRRLDLPPRLQNLRRRKAPPAASKLQSRVAKVNSADEQTEESEESEQESQMKPRIASSVVSTSRILRTREDLIGLVNDVPNSKDQNSTTEDDQFRKRNRRMLGLVMNTLNEFKQQTERHEDPSARRCQEVEDRRRKAAEEENHRLQEERRKLVEKKRAYLDEQRAVVAELERAEQIQYWKKSGDCLMNFIRTEAKPSIFWRPALLEAKAKRRLDQSNTKVQTWIERKLQGLQNASVNQMEEKIDEVPEEPMENASEESKSDLMLELNPDERQQ